MPTDDPLNRIGLVPTFRQPPTLTPPPPAADQDPDPSPSPNRPGPVPTFRQEIHPGNAGGPDSAAAAPGPRLVPRTETSSDSDPVHKPTESEATGLLIGLIGVAAVTAAAVVRWRLRRKLRPPTKGQTRDIAEPLARIALRLTDLGWLGPNIIDGIKAATATGVYINDGPLLLGDSVGEPGIPDDLQESYA